MLKKTSASAGLVIVTAAGALLASSPAYALDSLISGSHSRSHHRSHHRNRNWNGHRHHARIFIRIYIYNKNNNHAVALAHPERRRRPIIRDAMTPTAFPVTATRAEPTRTTPREVVPAPASTPAETTRTPASTTPQQSTSAAPVAPAATPASVPMDETATG